MKLTRVKICGLMSADDIELCARYDVNAVGFVVEYPIDVPWNIMRQRARELVSLVPPYMARVIVVGGSTEDILAITDFVEPDAVQIHHDETVEQTRDIVAALADHVHSRHCTNGLGPISASHGSTSHAFPEVCRAAPSSHWQRSVQRRPCSHSVTCLALHERFHC